MFESNATNKILEFFFLLIFFFGGGVGGGGGGGGGGVGRRGAGVKGFFFSQRIQIKKMPILDLELAIHHPPPGGVLYTMIF